MNSVTKDSPSRSGSPLGRMLSLIETPLSTLRFLILDCPTDTTLRSFYLAEFQKLGVTDVVRVCEPTYNTAPLEDINIRVHDWPFRDGGVPPSEVLKAWLSLLNARVRAARVLSTTNGDGVEVRPTIAVHCVAGLGRAPALIAVALIELGLPALDAVEHIRRRRRGAFNTKQIEFLDNYKRKANFTATKSLSSGSSFKSSFGKVFKFGKKEALANLA